LLRVERSSEQSDGRGLAGLFLVPLAAARSPLDYVLAGMVAAGQGIEALCLYVGLARTVLLDRIVALDLPTPHDRPLRRPCGKHPWLAGDVQELTRLWVAGVRVVCIANLLRRSPGAIWSKARRTGLPKRDRTKQIWLEPSSWPVGIVEPAPVVPAACEAPVADMAATVPTTAPVHAFASAPTTPAPEKNGAIASPALALGSVAAAEGRPIAAPQTTIIEPDVAERATCEATVADIAATVRDAAPVVASPSLQTASVSERNEATAPRVLPLGSVVVAEGEPIVAQRGPARVADAATGVGRRRKQSRPGQITWFREADEIVGLRWWADQHAKDIAREMSDQCNMELTASAVSSRCHRLQLPPRYGNTLVKHFDPSVAERNIKASGYVSRFCPGKKRIFWTKPRWGQRFCDEYKRSKTFQDRAGGLDECYA
jgi:hypothetical protein